MTEQEIIILNEVLDEFKKHLNSKREKTLNYINEYFTKEEAIRHSDNLAYDLTHGDGDIAYLQLMLMAKGIQL